MSDRRSNSLLRHCPRGYLSLTSISRACSLQVAFAYTDGSYSKGLQVDSRPGGCCKPAYWTVSKKDYTTPQEGKTNAKLYPKKEVLASTVKVKKSNRGKPWGVKLPDAKPTGMFSGPPLAFSVKNKMICCAGCTQWPMCTNCNDGVMKGKFCMNFKNPIYNLDGTKGERLPFECSF